MTATHKHHQSKQQRRRAKREREHEESNTASHPDETLAIVAKPAATIAQSATSFVRKHWVACAISVAGALAFVGFGVLRRP